MKRVASLFIPLHFFTDSSKLLNAKVTLPSFFSDNMVLQQKTEAAIWVGQNQTPTVQLTSSWNKKKYTVQSDQSGKWKLKITTPEAGGPYEITISDGETITLHNILIGEVWFCSGQSNMEMPMKGFRDQPIKGSNDAIFNSTNDWIRFIMFPVP
jgi:sialate O-acetylesterase